MDPVDELPTLPTSSTAVPAPAPAPPAPPEAAAIVSCRSGERGDVDKSLFSEGTVYFSPLAPTVAKEAAADGAAIERARAPVGSGMRPEAMACWVGTSLTMVPVALAT